MEIIMPACILRFAGTKSLVGFYAADSENDLFDLVDEETSPGDYEYAILRYGYGLEFRVDGDPVEYEIGTEEELGAAIKGSQLYLTSGLAYALATGERLIWRRFFQDA
jgi:hypothetical protein